MNRNATTIAAVVAFVLFAGIYLGVAAANDGITVVQWIVALIGGLVLAAVAAALAAAIGRRRSGGGRS
ncbi:hypothetical protein WHI96_25955 [Pseudonocardia tropica]|uniref:Uncharacterized protein n=1 Tax=Pseudonocardia tropica TaxID=681289 RepID=A0ABV1K203_9PSEU